MRDQRNSHHYEKIKKSSRHHHILMSYIGLPSRFLETKAPRPSPEIDRNLLVGIYPEGPVKLEHIGGASASKTKEYASKMHNRVLVEKIFELKRLAYLNEDEKYAGQIKSQTGEILEFLNEKQAEIFRGIGYFEEHKFKLDAVSLLDSSYDEGVRQRFKRERMQGEIEKSLAQLITKYTLCVNSEEGLLEETVLYSPNIEDIMHKTLDILQSCKEDYKRAGKNPDSIWVELTAEAKDVEICINKNSKNNKPVEIGLIKD